MAEYNPNNHVRELFDFFDSKEIWVCVVLDPFNLEFDWEVIFRENSRILTYESKKLLPTRKEAETAAFTKAFSILEEQLNK